MGWSRDAKGACLESVLPKSHAVFSPAVGVCPPEAGKLAGDIGSMPHRCNQWLHHTQFAAPSYVSKRRFGCHVGEA